MHYVLANYILNLDSLKTTVTETGLDGEEYTYETLGKNANGFYMLQFSDETHKRYNFSVGDVLCIGESTTEATVTSIFVKVAEIAVINGTVHIFATDADVGDVYDEIDVNYSDIVSPSDMINSLDTEEIKNEMLSNGSLDRVTKFMAYYIAASDTVIETLGSSKDHLKDYYVKDDTLVTLLNASLLRGAEVSISIGEAYNNNFEPGYENNFIALQITFNYEASVKGKLDIQASITFTQYLAASAQGYLDYKTGFFEIKYVDFDAALNLYSQTDLDLKVLVRTVRDGEANKNDKKDDDNGFMDIAEEIKEKLESDDDDPDNIVKELRQMLDAENGYLELFRIDILNIPIDIIPVLRIMQINIELDFVVEVNFAAGISSHVSVLEATQIGIRGDTREKSLESYKNDLIGSNQYVMDLSVCGYLGLRAGFKGGLSVSFCGLSSLGKVGVYVNVGSYIDIYGFAQAMLINTTYEKYATVVGGYYIEIGLFLEVTLEARSDMFGVKVGTVLFDKKWPFATFGSKEVLLSINPSDMQTVYIEGDDPDHADIDINKLPPLTGEYIDITTGEVVTRDVPWNKVYLKFSDRKFSHNIQNRHIIFNRTSGEDSLIAECIAEYHYLGSYMQFKISSDASDLFFPLIKTKVIYYDGSKLDKTDIGKTYKVKVWCDEEGYERVFIGESEFEAGSRPRVRWMADSTKYCDIQWQQDQSEMYVTGDTDIVFTAKRRQVLIAFSYLDPDTYLWTTEIRACNLGEEPVPPTIKEGDKLHFKKWGALDGTTNKLKSTTSVESTNTEHPGIVPNFSADDIKQYGYFMYMTSGYDINTPIVKKTSEEKHINDLYMVLYEEQIDDRQMFYSIASIYIALYDYDPCEVTIINSDADGNKITEKHTVEYRGVPKTTRLLSPGRQKLLGYALKDGGPVVYEHLSNYYTGGFYKDLTLYAVYEPIIYNVKIMYFDKDSLTLKEHASYTIGGEQDLSTVDFDGAWARSSGEDGVEYRFFGFYYDWSAGSLQISPTDECVSDMVIYPRFERRVNITLTCGDGEFIPGSDAYDVTSSYQDYKVTIGERCGKPSDATNRYRQTGWRNKETGEIYPINTEIVLSSPVTLEAVYTEYPIEYTLEVVADYGVFEAGVSRKTFTLGYAEYLEQIAYYKTLKPSEVYVPDKHWTVKYEKYTLIEISATETRIIYTYKNVYDTHTVNIDVADGTLGNGQQASITQDYGTTLDLTKISASKKDDKYTYKIAYWKDANGNRIETGIYTVTHDITLTAVWEIDQTIPYTITLYLDGKQIKTLEFAKDDPITGIEKPTQASGLVFSGWTWYDGDTVTDPLSKMPAKHLVLRGTTTKVFIHYKVDGYVEKTIQGYVGSEIKIDSIFEKTGHTCTPWATTDVTVSNGRFIMPEHDVTFESTTTPNTYQVTYLHNGKVYSEQTYTFGSSVSLIPVPKETGKYYLWASEDIRLAESGFMMPAMNVTITSKQTEAKTYIIYYINDEICGYEIAVDGAVISLPAPDASKYPDMTFSGWYVQDQGLSGNTFVSHGEEMHIRGYFTKGSTKINVYLGDNAKTPALVLYADQGATLSPKISLDEYDCNAFRIGNDTYSSITVGDEREIDAYAVYTAKSYTVFYTHNERVEYTDQAQAGEKVYLRDQYSTTIDTVSEWISFDGIEIKEDETGKYFIMPDHDVYFNVTAYYKAQEGDTVYTAHVLIKSPFASSPIPYEDYPIYSEAAPKYFDVPMLYGCEFVCWQDEDGKVINGVKLSDMKGSDRNYYAIFRKISLHVATFRVDGKVVSYQLFYDRYSVDVSYPTFAIRDGYVLTSWINPYVKIYDVGRGLQFLTGSSRESYEYAQKDLVFDAYTYSDSEYTQHRISYTYYNSDGKAVSSEMIKGDSGDRFEFHVYHNEAAFRFELVLEYNGGQRTDISALLVRQGDKYILILPTLDALSEYLDTTVTSIDTFLIKMYPAT